MAFIPLHNGLLQVFDVNHGGCSLLTIPTATGIKRVLIDCGHTNRGTQPWYPGRHLKALGVKHIDALLVTNYDEDHVSGFVDLLAQGLTIGCIFGNPSVAPEIIQRLKTEDGIGPGIAALVNVMTSRRQAAHIEALPIISGLEISWCCNLYPHFEDENNLSMAFRLGIHGFNFLFTGDLEQTGFKELLRNYSPFQQMVGSTHVLMASHHGRENGIYRDIFDLHGCRPAVVVISDDYKQHASQETTNYYASKAQGIRGFRGQDWRHVLTTRNDGELVFTFRDGGCFVR